jgi:hypothetical protein
MLVVMTCRRGRGWDRVSTARGWCVGGSGSDGSALDLKRWEDARQSIGDTLRSPGGHVHGVEHVANLVIL